MAVDMVEFDELMAEIRSALDELRRQVVAEGWWGTEGTMQWAKRVMRRIEDVRLKGSHKEVEECGSR